MFCLVPSKQALFWVIDKNIHVLFHFWILPKNFRISQIQIVTSWREQNWLEREKNDIGDNQIVGINWLQINSSGQIFQLTGHMLKSFHGTIAHSKRYKSNPLFFSVSGPFSFYLNSKIWLTTYVNMYPTPEQTKEND